METKSSFAFALLLVPMLALTAAQVAVRANYDDADEHIKVFTINGKLELACPPVAEKTTVELRWFHNGTSVSKKADFKDRVESSKSEHKLVIQKALATDDGSWECRDKEDRVLADFNVIARVAVKLPAHTAVVEGEKLKIVCLALGTNPVIGWNITQANDNQTNFVYDFDGDSTIMHDRIKISDSEEAKGAVLTIDPAKEEDRGTYMCRGINKIFLENESTKSYATPINVTTFLRVKDKYAALWPFIGICAEVFILCAIILIYEKRRNKTDLDDSDTDGSPDQKNDHHPKGDVRQRK